MRQKVLIKLKLSFTNDYLYYKFAYIVDINKEVLEVFYDAEEKEPDY